MHCLSTAQREPRASRAPPQMKASRIVGFRSSRRGRTTWNTKLRPAVVEPLHTSQSIWPISTCPSRVRYRSSPGSERFLLSICCGSTQKTSPTQGPTKACASAEGPRLARSMSRLLRVGGQDSWYAFRGRRFGRRTCRSRSIQPAARSTASLPGPAWPAERRTTLAHGRSSSGRLPDGRRRAIAGSGLSGFRGLSSTALDLGAEGKNISACRAGHARRRVDFGQGTVDCRPSCGRRRARHPFQEQISTCAPCPSLAVRSSWSGWAARALLLHAQTGVLRARFGDPLVSSSLSSESWPASGSPASVTSRRQSPEPTSRTTPDGPVRRGPHFRFTSRLPTREPPTHHACAESMQGFRLRERGGHRLASPSAPAPAAHLRGSAFLSQRVEGRPVAVPARPRPRQGLAPAAGWRSQAGGGVSG